ncbi:hypothetical protein [Clostridium sp. LP20]|uniref:hypothetical protein n=1 Tax=Clostridium sp. LP20 TaxID=3418665 RepID=UPI003EE43BB8
MKEGTTLNKALRMKGNREKATLYSEIAYEVEFKNNTSQDIFNVKVPIKIPSHCRYKEDSLYINGKKYSVNKGNEFKISVFPSKSILKLNYSTIVNEIPLSGQIDNNIVISYNPSNNEESIRRIYSNIVVTKIKGVKLHIEKVLDKKEYGIGDLIEEEIIIRNDGNIKAINLILEEIFPKGILLEKIKLGRDELERGKNYKYIKIGNLEVAGTINIRIIGKIVDIDIREDRIKTKAKYDYFDDYEEKYILETIESKEIPLSYRIEEFDNSLGNIDEKNSKESSNEEDEVEEIDITVEKINCEIISDKENYIVGDRGVFNLYIDNLGSRALERVSIKINIPEGIQVINNDVFIDNNRYKYNNESDGIILDRIDANEGIELKYYGLIEECKKGDFIETSYIVKGYYNYGNEVKEEIKEYIGPVLRNKVDDISLKYFFVSDQEVLLLGKEVKYTITIINDGTLPVKIKYRLEHGNEIQELLDTKYAADDGGVEYKEEINIERNDGVVLDKSFVYTRFRGNKLIGAKGIIDIYYKGEGDREYSYKKLETDTLEIEASNTTFEEVVVEDEIDISEVTPRMREVSNVYFNPTIISENIRSINRDMNYDSKDIIGYSLSYVGNLSYTIEYLGFEGDDVMYFMSREKVFSSSINLPDTYVDGEKISIIPEILDLNYKIVDSKRLFITINLLINTNI